MDRETSSLVIPDLFHTGPVTPPVDQSAKEPTLSQPNTTLPKQRPKAARHGKATAAPKNPVTRKPASNGPTPTRSRQTSQVVSVPIAPVARPSDAPEHFPTATIAPPPASLVVAAKARAFALLQSVSVLPALSLAAQPSPSDDVAKCRLVVAAKARALELLHDASALPLPSIAPPCVTKVLVRPCVICQSEEAAYIVQKCMHLCLCAGCVDEFKSKESRCPLCRADVESVNRVF